MNSDLLIHLAEASAVLREMGIHTRYNAVHRLIVDGRLPAVRVGRRIMLRREDLPVAARLLRETSAACSA